MLDRALRVEFPQHSESVTVLGFYFSLSWSRVADFLYFVGHCRQWEWMREKWESPDAGEKKRNRSSPRFFLCRQHWRQNIGYSRLHFIAFRSQIYNDWRISNTRDRNKFRQIPIHLAIWVYLASQLSWRPLFSELLHYIRVLF